MEARHKKEIKALDGEKRAAIKKAKGTKGKKSKEMMAELEAEFEQKLRILLDKHKEEQGDTAPSQEATDVATESPQKDETNTTANDEDAKEKKLAKVRRKREKAREKELEREAALLQSEKDAGPSARDEEMAAIRLPEHLQIVDTTADGHCLYRSVAAQLTNSAATYHTVRNLCADSLLQHRADLEAFVEDDTPFETYVDQVRNTATWGGSLELRALALTLQRPIVVYSTAPNPLIMGDDLETTAPPIRLSYHLHYYALGAHYNRVAEKKRNAEVAEDDL